MVFLVGLYLVADLDVDLVTALGWAMEADFRGDLVATIGAVEAGVCVTAVGAAAGYNWT